MLLDVYISELEGYDFDGDFRIGNSPGPWSEFFPQPSGGSRHFYEVKRRVDDGRFKGRQVDWGCWVAIVTREQIWEYVADIYGERFKDLLERYTEESYAHLRKSINELMDFIDKLEDGKEYLLAASEI